MRTAASANPEPPELTYGTFNGFAYMPAMPGIAYRVLFRLIGTQEPGGRCLVTEEELAKVLEVHRSMVGRGLQALILSRLVYRQAKGIYVLNPMISGARSVPEHLEAIGSLDPADRLDVDDYQQRYDAAVARAEQEKREKRLGRQNAQARPKPVSAKASDEMSAEVLSLSTARDRSRRRRPRS
ncbi:hypothetical protein ACIP29_36400 [Streptomyces coelicoflavus]|uniref:hypothetical protein n=1 Tax=Streptomyces coelicoflavus TaxID=285562 RepID=UPI00024765BF|nr:hypothetical protein SMCF_165 [Streptomyces coelicoflavus ZG0656]MZE45904.1 hypothetical protein [Streptomyces sp. SID5477]